MDGKILIFVAMQKGEKMSNLDWIRSLSAEELTEWFYGTWIPKMSRSVTDSYGYLIEWLNQTAK